MIMHFTQKGVIMDASRDREPILLAEKIAEVLSAADGGTATAALEIAGVLIQRREANAWRQSFEEHSRSCSIPSLSAGAG